MPDQVKHFKIYSKQDILQHTRVRKFETKIGESIQCIHEKVNTIEEIRNSHAEYVVFGIPEDIGVRGNYGIGGTDSIWTSFLSSFLNFQSNDFFSGMEVLLLGHFDFNDMKLLIEQNAHDAEEKILAYRHAVLTIDDEVEQIVKIITEAGKIPVAIGGGHNNSYPMIKGSSKGLHKMGKIPLAQINCVNLDSHADFRPAEGRHSGNGFRYAEEDGYLQKYCIVGLHENYLPQNVWLDIANNPFIDFVSYEDIFLHEKRNFIQAVAHATGFTEEGYTGVELDMDAIEHVLSSATTPTGLQPLHARQYVSFTSVDCKVAYLHICEGATILADGRKMESTGKLAAYLVSDFIKAR